MKKIILIFAVSILVFSFTEIINKNSAMVDQEQGIYIFVKSKPTFQYKYLGSLTIDISLTGQPNEMLKTMLKKTKKQYPQADGIIFTSNDMDKVDCIKFE